MSKKVIDWGKKNESKVKESFRKKCDEWGADECQKRFEDAASCVKCTQKQNVSCLRGCLPFVTCFGCCSK